MALSPIGQTFDPGKGFDPGRVFGSGNIFKPGKLPKASTNATKFAAKVAAIMKANTPDSYRFIVCEGDVVAGSGAGGFARRAVDAPEMPAKLTDRHNICSMSKTITAAAVLAALQAKGLSPDIAVAPFLPPDWKLHDDAKTITFRQFLSHHSGYHWEPEAFAPKQDGTGFEEIRTILKQKPHFPVGTVESYRNISAAIFRIVLPYLDAYDRYTGKIELTVVPPLDRFLARRYVDIVNRLVLKPAGVAPAGCDSRTLARPAGATGRPPPVGLEVPVLAYRFGNPKAQGYDVGDRTNGAGADGWCLSVGDIARVLQTVFHTEAILSEKSRGYMALAVPGAGCGMFADEAVAGSAVHSHGAVIPFEDGIEGAKLCGWYMYFDQPRITVVVLSNAGHDPAVVANQGNWDARVKTAFAEVYGT